MMDNNNNPLISVIMPVYNGERFLRQAIDSILSQTYRNFELLIINDGSTDATESIIQSFKDKRIRYVKNEHNLKLIKTLNKGVSLATGKFIARMDADDIAHPLLFEKQIETFLQDKSIDIVNISTYELCENGAKYRKSSRVVNFLSDTLIYVEVFENQITHPGIMVRADLMKKYGYKDDGSVVNFEDVDLWIRMLFDGHKCVTLTQRLLFYRINNKSVTRTIGNKRNILRVGYLQNVLHDKFGLETKSDTLYYLYGEVKNSVCCPSDIVDMLKLISRKIDNDNVRKQFETWAKMRLLIVSIQIMKSYPVLYKLKVLKFILLHLDIACSSAFFKFLRFKLTNKWMTYESINVG